QHLSSSLWLFSAVRFLFAFCLLCVPATLMGATLPVLSRYIVRNNGTLGWSVGTLYALNTGGAVLGCFIAGYVLVGSLGLLRTVWIGAAVNLAIALVVWVGQRWMERAPSTLAAPPSMGEEEPYSAGIYDRKTVRRVLWCFALAGYAALSYEVIWTRALTF